MKLKNMKSKDLNLKKTYEVVTRIANDKDPKSGEYLAEFIGQKETDSVQLSQGRRSECMDQSRINESFNSDVMRRAFLANDWHSCCALVKALKLLLPPEQQTAQTIVHIMRSRFDIIPQPDDILQNDLAGTGEHKQQGVIWGGYHAFEDYKEIQNVVNKCHDKYNLRVEGFKPNRPTSIGGLTPDIDNLYRINIIRGALRHMAIQEVTIAETGGNQMESPEHDDKPLPRPYEM